MDFEKKIKTAKKEAFLIRDEIAILFSSYIFDDTAAREKKLYESIETFKFGLGKEEFIQNGMQGSMMSRDAEAIRQGKMLPTWLYYQGVGFEAQKFVESADDFKILVNKFLRQLEMNVNRELALCRKDDLFSIHPQILSKCESLYKKGEFSEAVEKGFKIVRDRLRDLTGYETGSKAFGNTKLHIKGAAAPNVDKDFNEAVKFLTMSIDLFRNEKSHTSDSRIEDPVRAYEYLRLSSLAMRLLDGAEILQ